MPTDATPIGNTGDDDAIEFTVVFAVTGEGQNWFHVADNPMSAHNVLRGWYQTHVWNPAYADDDQVWQPHPATATVAEINAYLDDPIRFVRIMPWAEFAALLRPPTA